jgi:hypothetical protein
VLPNLWDFWLATDDDGKSRAILAGGNSSGKVSAMVRYAKDNPQWKVVVPDVNSLDLMVRLGLQPSQIIVTEELVGHARDFVTVSVLKEGDVNYV